LRKRRRQRRTDLLQAQAEISACDVASSLSRGQRPTRSAGPGLDSQGDADGAGDGAACDAAACDVAVPRLRPARRVLQAGRSPGLTGTSRAASLAVCWGFCYCYWR
jgi:hypothetical protein